MNIGATTAVNAAVLATTLTARRQEMVKRHLREAGALSHDQAVALPDGVSEHAVEALSKSGVLVEVWPGLWFLDEARSSAVDREQGKHGMAVIVGLVIVMAAVIAVAVGMNL